MSAAVANEGLSCWVLSEGMAGTENQCLALAAALGLKPEIKRAAAKKPWLWLGAAMAALPPWLLAQGHYSLAPPWPDLVIASGRKCAGLALAIQRASRGRTFTVFVQNPRLGLARFDLIVVPRHDGIVGANIFTTRGALSRVNAVALNAAAAEFAPAFADLPRPLVACLIGGASRRHRFTSADGRALGEALAKLSAETGGGLLITPSRRTPAPSFAALEVALDGAPAYIWRGKGANPYLGFLAVANAVLVTGDSVSMVSDACASGKPVHIFPVAGRRSARFSRFFAALEAEDAVRPFTGSVESRDYEPLNDCTLAADEIHRRLETRQKTK
ncbi:MAG: mitochondrial fission ELM1 family protein [Proteobacteria bacterium]|nr:mitochondrial fission ELM1 family protein [Pseudomonadota bacterium]MDA1354738.1 mitochondrial fission ELM1 family protein [Pseudomonadota bacterium]